MNRKHIDSRYESQLDELRRRLLLMAGLVEDMLANACHAFAERDADLAARTIECDARVNRGEMDLDAHCLRILATRQPVASDLRFITLTLKMVTDLERIGDLAVNMSHQAIDWARRPPLSAGVDIAVMSHLAHHMVTTAVDALSSRDAGLARSVLEMDNTLDAAYTRLVPRLLGLMLDDPEHVERGLQLQSIAKSLERVGDHATNLAEQVIFLLQGQDVRHGGPDDAPASRDAPRPPSTASEGESGARPLDLPAASGGPPRATRRGSK